MSTGFGPKSKLPATLSSLMTEAPRTRILFEHAVTHANTSILTLEQFYMVRSGPEIPRWARYAILGSRGIVIDRSQ
jgi:hypothetical protein